MSTTSTIYEGNLTIRNAEDAKKYSHLTKVTGNLSIYSSAKLDALKSVGGDLSIYSKAELVANKLYTGGYSKFKVYDDIPCVVLSTKQRGEFTILSCRRAKIKNQKVVGDKFFVAQKDGYNAHAKMIEVALAELQFKTGDRDVSEYKNMPRDTKKKPKEWAFIYHVTTGACKLGISFFMEKKGKLKPFYTLEQIIAETKGAYRHDVFVAVVGGEK